MRTDHIISFFLKIKFIKLAFYYHEEIEKNFFNLVAFSNVMTVDVTKKKTNTSAWTFANSTNSCVLFFFFGTKRTTFIKG